MNFSRNDLVGGGCALAALALIAWLSVENQILDDCRNLLKTALQAAEAAPDTLETCRQKLGQKAP